MDRKTRFHVESKYCHNFTCLWCHHMYESSWRTKQLVDVLMTAMEVYKCCKTASQDIYTRLHDGQQGCVKGVTQFQGSLPGACERTLTPPLPHQNINGLTAVSALLHVWTCKSKSFSAYVQKGHDNRKHWYTSDPWQITHQVVPLYVQRTQSCRRVNDAFLTPGESHFYGKCCTNTPASTNRMAAQLPYLSTEQ